MYLNNIYFIIILLISLSCNNQKGWGKDGVGESFTIKRQQSYNYSEMLSGDLDSTENIEFDNYKEKITEKKDDELDLKNTNIVRKIVKDIKKNKQKALLKYEKKFSNNTKINPTKNEINNSIKALDPKIKNAIDFAYSRILKFH